MKKTSFALITATLLSPFAYSAAHADGYDAPSMPAPEVCNSNAHSDMVYFKHVEGKGYGYKEGYSTLGAFITPYSTFSHVLPFLDLRGHVFNRHWKFAANAGVGVKWLSNSPFVLAAAAYYDYRQTHHSHYNQVGLSLEFLWNRWEFRANGYLPVGEKTHVRKISETASYSFEKFAGHSLFYTTTLDIHRKVEFAMKGVDAELGFHLMHPQEFYTLYLGGGPYYFHSPSGLKKHALGGQVRIQARVTPYITLQISDSWDNLFHNKFQGEISLNIPFGGHVMKRNGDFKAPCCEVLSMESRMVQPMHRNEIIVADTTKQHYYKTIDPIAQSIYGGPLNFIFVNASAPSGGNGTFENPFNDIYTANLASNFNDVFYVSGDFTLTSEPVYLTQNQSFLGSAMPQAVPIQVTPTQIAYVTIPAMSQATPSITQETPSAHLIYANGDNILIRGFTLTQTLDGYSAITNQSIFLYDAFIPTQNITITNNTLNYTGYEGYGVWLKAFSGTALIENNAFYGFGLGRNGILLDQEGAYGTNAGSSVANINILNNTFTDWSGSGVLLAANNTSDGASVINALIMNNNSSNNPPYPGVGFWTIASGNSTINATFVNNTAQYNDNNGFQIEAHDEATTNIYAYGNNFSNNSNGIYIDIDGSATAYLELSNNTINSNGSTGISFPTPSATQTAVSLTALFTGNIIRENAYDGVNFATQNGTVTSKLTFENNVILDNGNGNGNSFVLVNGVTSGSSSSTTTVFMNGNINNNYGYGFTNYNTDDLSFNIEQGGSNQGIITLVESTSPQTGPYNFVERHTAAP